MKIEIEKLNHYNMQTPQIMMLSKSEQSFLLKRIEKALKKWKRKQVKKSKHKAV